MLSKQELLFILNNPESLTGIPQNNYFNEDPLSPFYKGGKMETISF